MGAQPLPCHRFIFGKNCCRRRWLPVNFSRLNTTAMCRGFSESAASCFPEQHYFMTEPGAGCEPIAFAIAPNTMRNIRNSAFRRKTLSAIGIGNTGWVCPERIKLGTESRNNNRPLGKPSTGLSEFNASLLSKNSHLKALSIFLNQNCHWAIFSSACASVCVSPSACNCEVHGLDNGQWDACWWGIPITPNPPTFAHHLCHLYRQ